MAWCAPLAFFSGAGRAAERLSEKRSVLEQDEDDVETDLSVYGGPDDQDQLYRYESKEKDEKGCVWLIYVEVPCPPQQPAPHAALASSRLWARPRPRRRPGPGSYEKPGWAF